MTADALEKLRALAHPLRLQILSLLTGTAMSAAEVARETGTTQANASYHLRRLHAAGQIELVEVVSVRGGRARRFRYDPEHIVDLGWSSGDPARGTPAPAVEEAQVVIRAYAQEMVRRAGLRMMQGPTTSTDAELWLDPEVWALAVERSSQISLLLHRAARPPRTPGTVRTSTTVSMFRMDPAARPVPFEGQDVQGDGDLGLRP